MRIHHCRKQTSKYEVKTHKFASAKNNSRPQLQKTRYGHCVFRCQRCYSCGFPGTRPYNKYCDFLQKSQGLDLRLKRLVLPPKCVCFTHVSARTLTELGCDALPKILICHPVTSICFVASLKERFRAKTNVR